MGLTAAVSGVLLVVAISSAVYFAIGASRTSGQRAGLSPDEARLAMERLLHQAERAREDLIRQLERDAGTLRKQAAVAAREQAHAIAAGAEREIRILVESERISDEASVWLSRDIARRIENELEYPGQIKVTVIRETRAVEYAR